MIFDLIGQLHSLSFDESIGSKYLEWLDLHSTIIKQISRSKLPEKEIQKIFLSSYCVPELIAEALVLQDENTEITKRLYVMKMHKQEQAKPGNF